MDERKMASPDISATPETSSADVQTVLNGSETFAYFKSNGIKPPSVKSWKKVLSELGKSTVEGNLKALKAYAEETKDSNLTDALRDVSFVVTEDVSEMDYDSAKDKYIALFGENRQLEEQIGDYEEKLASHQKEYGNDAGHAVYINKFESKIAAAKTRLLEIEDLIEKLEDEFGLSSDVLEE
ncbi:MAG: hypothetical protein RDU25_02340 [Patescibacteria group bacterium]|nr:hypothetical protein [Patescibacteria group bacterium]